MADNSAMWVACDKEMKAFMANPAASLSPSSILLDPAPSCIAAAYAHNASILSKLRESTTGCTSSNVELVRLPTDTTMKFYAIGNEELDDPAFDELLEPNQQIAAREESDYVLVYDGSFAPIHEGHFDMMRVAVEYARTAQLLPASSRLRVQISINHPQHVTRKLQPAGLYLDAQAYTRFAAIRHAFAAGPPIFSPELNAYCVLWRGNVGTQHAAPVNASMAHALRVTSGNADRVLFAIGSDAFQMNWRLPQWLAIGIRVLCIHNRTSPSKGVDSFVEPGVVFVRSSRPLLEFSSTHVREVCSAPLGKSSEEEATVLALLAKALGGGPRWQSVATFVRSHRFFRARPFVFGICGLSGSGKSTLGRAITQQVSVPAEMISSDNFLKWGELAPLGDDFPHPKTRSKEIIRRDGGLGSGVAFVLVPSLDESISRETNTIPLDIVLRGSELKPESLFFWEGASVIHAATGKLLTSRAEPEAVVGSGLKSPTFFLQDFQPGNAAQQWEPVGVERQLRSANGVDHPGWSLPPTSETESRWANYEVPHAIRWAELDKTVGELTARTDLGVVVLEGAHLLYSPELMGKCDVILFLDIEESEAQRRRFGRRVPTDQSRQIAEMEYSKRCMIPHAARVNEIAQRNSVNLGGNVIKITVEDSFEIVVQHAFHHVPQFLLKK